MAPTVEELHLRIVPNATCDQTSGMDYICLTYQSESCRDKSSEVDYIVSQVRLEIRQVVLLSKLKDLVIPLFGGRGREMTLL